MGRKRAEQAQLPGMVDEKIAAVDRAANAYLVVRDERMGLTKREVELRTKLLQTMQENGKNTYHSPDGLTVEIIPGETKVKVRRSGESDEED